MNLNEEASCMTTQEAQDNANDTIIGRRTLLKALSAVGLSAVAPFLIPDVWASPTGKSDISSTLRRILGGQGADPNAFVISLECDPPVPLASSPLPEIHDSDILLGVDEGTGILTKDTHRVNFKVNFRSPGRVTDPSSLEISAGYDTPSKRPASDSPGEWGTYRPLTGDHLAAQEDYLIPSWCPKDETLRELMPGCTKSGRKNGSNQASFQRGTFHFTGLCDPGMSEASVRLRASTGDPASPFIYSNDATCKIPWTKG
jgi:hypothetical protein